MIWKLAVLLRVPDVAVTLAVCVPTSAAAGAREMVVVTPPVAEVGAFSVANAGSEDVSVTVLSGWPVATTFTVRVVPAVMLTSEIGETVGAWAQAGAMGARSSRPSEKQRSKDFMGPP